MLRAWPRLFAIHGLFALVLLAFWPGTVLLGRLWADFGTLTYTHGYAVAAVSMWLIFRARHALAAAPARPSLQAFLACLMGAGLWIVLWRADIRDGHLSLLPVLLWLAAWAAFGWRAALPLAFPLGYLLFAVPGWDILTLPLQVIATLGVRALMPLTGEEFHMAGNLVYVPAGVFEVAPECSGLHFLIVGLSLAALLGEVNRDALRTRIVQLAIMGGLALLANCIRIVTIVVAGARTGMQHSLITDGHYSYGWGVFAAAFVLFLLLARALPTSAARPCQRSVSL